MEAVVRCGDLVHVYRVAGTDVAALRGIDLQVLDGQSVALLGPSGSGKSTLMSIVSAVLRPSAGRVEVLGVPLHTAGRRDVHRLRASGLGLMLQGAAANLVPYADAWSNVAWTVRSLRRGDLGVAERVLEPFGLARERRAVSQLPPAEQQVVAMAVALATTPRLLVADEPTSQLPDGARDRLLGIMTEVMRASGSAVLMVTHDEGAARHLDRMIHLRDGRIAEEATAVGRYSVLGSDGAVPLPASATDRWPAGTLLTVVDDGEQVVVTRADP